MSTKMKCEYSTRVPCTERMRGFLKWSAISLGFNEAETNCIVTHIFDILLLISYRFDFHFSDIIVICTVSICSAADRFSAVLDEHFLVHFSDIVRKKNTRTF